MCQNRLQTALVKGVTMPISKAANNSNEHVKTTRWIHKSFRIKSVNVAFSFSIILVAINTSLEEHARFIYRI